jgi:hypothetical protein
MTTFTIDREELAWAAGFFDGEGSPYFAKNVRTAGITIGQTDREVLDRFVKSVQLGKVTGPYGPYGSGKKPIFYIRIVSHWQTQHIAAALWPWLGTEKKEQFVKVLSESLLTPARPDRRTRSQEAAFAQGALA